MSEVAKTVRVYLLRQQANAAKREVIALWQTAELAVGLGGEPPLGMEARIAAAMRKAEGLVLEWKAAL